MAHRYKVREIAQQAGLSEATVDRVLHQRPGVRENTVAEVNQAIADLDKQRAQLRLNGRRYLVDVVMQTPRRFSDAFRAAVEAELPAFAPAMLRARFHLWESGSTDQMVDTLDRIRGSHGVVLKAQDEPEVAEVVDRLVRSGVPVVTYATDVPASARCAYVGIDNHGAGVTAAYLVQQWLADNPSDVLITVSRTVFRGEGEREVGFRSGLRHSGRTIVEVSESDGIDATNERLVLEALEAHPEVRAVYSVGGGNTATVAAFDKLGRDCRVFVAHDLDADNRRLLREGRISAVLHNDLRADARLALRLILQERGALPVEPVRPVPIQVITPYNIPTQG
ncbi:MULTISPECIES: LacI family DNA-binding transcriptional regulator [Mycobacteriaceae]|uniref:LacI family DNA-binding transcriptional regulator n=1 Tax=Mycolicibacterium parafortuitum TaxID=39692 RepID=A0ACC6MGE2_MYCPF|nr:MULTISPECIES: LacI family DNA-binding transcriptional regulator [Mycobacteriaceae]MDZ5085988.1 LacI family DNA-binding transcriptional regulator [Mycolicibacterium parafortuitum]GFM19053.1 LacI family transcriptional regulator [Mycobacterium sp. PO1]GFM25572.1 LacI family transcriptional regulator [Mycobacterium sp. PO2]